MNLNPLPSPAIPLPTASRPLRQYEAALLRLQELDDAGMNDSEEADAVRDGMDDPWTALSAAERELVGGLSADLFMVSDREIREPADSVESAAALDVRRAMLYSSERWLALLQLMRRAPTELPAPYVAYVRCVAYDRLGLHAAAARFAGRADELSPRDSYKALAIINCLEANDPVAAVQRSNAAIADPAASPSLLVVAAGALLASTRNVEPELAAPQWRRVIGAVGQALRGAAIDDDTRVNGLVYQGLAMEFLGDGQAARAAFASAAAIDPFSPLVRAARAGQPTPTGNARPSAQTIERRLRLTTRTPEYAAT